ncbi:MAG: hypothetical protein OXG24_09725, partial [Gammaproteobacteria bacterium]|nr:hypothetical protein [Gammaproteobacteria bacterium]
MGFTDEEEPSPLEVVKVTPLGGGVSTTFGRITIEFNKPMLAFGRGFQEFNEIPIEVTPDASCRWRATSANEFICLVGEDLQPETTYTIKVLDTAKSLDGSVLNNSREFTFKTALLSVEQRWPFWKSPTTPVFRLWFSRPVTLSTVVETVLLHSHDGSNEISVRATHSSELNRLGGDFFALGEDGQWHRMSDDEVDAFAAAIAEGIAATDAQKRNAIAGRNWYVEPATELEIGSLYSLSLGEGAKSIYATEGTKEAVDFWSFETFDEFTFMGLECTNTKDEIEQSLATDSEGNLKILDDCDPDKSVTLLFNSPVSRYAKARIPSVSPEPEPSDRYYRYFESGDRSTSTPRERVFKYSGNRYGWIGGRDDGLFRFNLPFKFRGKTEYSITDGAKPVTDLFDRTLTLSNPLTFRTGHMKPRLVGLARVAIFDFASPLELPLKFANLEKLQIGLATDIFDEENRSNREEVVDFEGRVDQVGDKTLDIRDWLHGKTGQFLAEFEPIAYPNVGESPRKTCLYGQLTPYNVHARMGLTSSIAWVTELDTGEVVPHASVELIQTEENQRNVIFSSKTNSDGIVAVPGKSELSHFPHIDRGYTGYYRLGGWGDDLDICKKAYYAKYALQISGPKGYAVLPLAQTFVNSDGRSPLHDEPHISIWGHTAQGIYSPGDEIQYKIYVRRQTGEGLRTIDESSKFLLVVLGSKGELVHFRDAIGLNEFGTFDGEFRVSESFLGTLRFLVLFDNGESEFEIQQLLPLLARSEQGEPRGPYDSHWVALSVDVLDFVPATIQLESSLDSDSYTNGELVTVRGRAELLSGGPFSEAPISVRLHFLPKRFEVELAETDGFKFAFSPTGRTPSVDGKTETNGTFQLSRRITFDEFFYGTMKVATGAQSDRGDWVWDYKHVDFRTTDRFVGIALDNKPKFAGSLVTADIVVADSTGRRKDDLPVNIEFAYSQSTYLGYRRDWKQVHSCRIAIGDNAKSCEFTPDVGGYYRASASLVSDSELPQKVEQEFWVRGKTISSTSDNWNYLRFKDQYSREREFTVGDTAELSIQHSIPGTKALVTVERLGVLDQWVIELDESGQFIDIPMKKEYSPRVRVSVVAMVPATPSESRSSAAFGVVQTRAQTQKADIFLKVNDPDPPIDIEILTDKDVYEPGENVRISINIEREDGRRISSPYELAVAVVDQGVLEVSKAGLAHFDPLQGFSSTFEFAVQGFGLLSRGFGTIYSSFAMAPSASHRPRPDPRENTELMSHWIPRLHTNASGEASFEFEAGDRLTEWKIIVVAADSADLFGYGHKSIRTKLDLEIHPILPNQVTVSDVFDASFFVLNRTDSERTVHVAVEVTGDVEPASIQDSIKLESYERKIVALPQHVLLDKDLSHPEDGSIKLYASATSGELADAVVHTLPLKPDRRIVFRSIYGTSTEPKVAEPVDFPRNIKTGSGLLDVAVTSSLVRSLDSKLSQIRDYPYSCWEHQLSKASIAAQSQNVQGHIGFDWPQAEEYIEHVLSLAADYQVRSGGFVYWDDGRDYAYPYLSAYTAQVLNWLADVGHEVPEEVVASLVQYLEERLEEEPSNLREIPSLMASSLRMMIANALIQHGRGDAELVERIYGENENLDPFALTQGLQAALAAEAPRTLLDQLSVRLENSIAVSGDKALVQHDVVRNGNILHSSMLKTTCSAITAYVQARSKNIPLISDRKLAELVRGAVYEWNKPKPRAIPHRSAYCLHAVAAYLANMEPEAAELDISVKLALGGLEHDIPVLTPEADGFTPDVATFSTVLEPKLLGEAGELVLRQDDESRIYYKATLQYEPLDTGRNAENHGINITKSYSIKSNDSWQEIDDATELSRGDLVRVSLKVDVRDPLD